MLKKYLIILYLLFVYIYCQDSYVLLNRDIGMETILPGKEWQLLKQSSQQSTSYIYSLRKNWSTRFVILVFDKHIYKNMQERAQEIAETSYNSYTQVSLVNTFLGEKEAERLIYRIEDTHIIEFGIANENEYLVFQLATHISFWETKDERRDWENVFVSFKWIDKSTTQIDKSSFQEITQQRKAFLQNKFLVKKHNIEVNLLPQQKTFLLKDTFYLQAQEDLVQAQLYTSFRNIKKIVSVDDKYKLQWDIRNSKIKNVQQLHIEITPPLKKNEILSVELTIHLQQKNFICESFFYPNTFSSDTIYNFSFHLPDEFDLITSCGKEQKIIEKKPQNIHHYEQKIVSKYPKFIGFAMGHFLKVNKDLRGGSVHIITVDQKQNKNIETVYKILQNLEEIMGIPPLETNVVLVPSKNFEVIHAHNFLVIYNNWEEENIFWDQLAIDSHLESLIPALSRLWLTNFSPEMEEGLGEYARLVFIEKWQGEKAYSQALTYLKQKYKKITESMSTEYAVAHPQTWKNLNLAKYKVPLIFAHLSNTIGKNNFVLAWREIFLSKADSYKIICDIFSKRANRNLISFFKQWFFMAGYPQIKISWEQVDVNIYVYFEQKQEQFFLLEGMIRITTELDVHLLPVQINKKQNLFIIISPEKVKNIELLLD